jgi:hypothetical protein
MLSCVTRIDFELRKNCVLIPVIGIADGNASLIL